MDSDRTHSWKAWSSWLLCGVLWGLSFLGILTVGFFALPLAVLLTILLLKDGLTERRRRTSWIGYAAWLALWALALFQVFPGGLFVLVASLLVLVGMRRAGPAGWGLLSGIGLWGVWLAVLGAEPFLGWLGIAAAFLATSAGLFTRGRKADQSIDSEGATQSAADQRG